MKNEEIVIAKIAKIAKKKGYNENCNAIYSFKELTKEGKNMCIHGAALHGNTNLAGEINWDSDPIDWNPNEIYYISAPTYHQLINWIFTFKGVLATNAGDNYQDEQEIANIEQTAIWLELWYNHLKDCPLAYEFKGRLLEWIRNNSEFSRLNLVELVDFENSNSYKEAEHQGIIEIFNLLKK